MLESSATVVQNHKPEVGARRVMLLNPPVYDTRFPWSHWQQPVTLLQLATLLHRYQCDVRLIDALYVKPNVKLTRRRARVLSRGEVSINYWRFGQLPSELAAQMRSWDKEGWHPDDIYIEGFTTFWWEGVIEAIALVRKKFPKARVILYGAYPSLATEHAMAHSGADLLIAGSMEGLTGLPLDLSLFPTRPLFSYLSIGRSARSSDEFVHEFLAIANPKNEQERIRQFAFVEHDVVKRFPEHIRTLLQTVIDKKLKVSFYALGNIYPRDLVDDPELASLLFRAGFKQLVFADDRDMQHSDEAREDLLESYHYAMKLCIEAGYRRRTEAIVGSVCIGRPEEQQNDVAAFITRIAHVAGSLIVVPYQPTPPECLTEPRLEYQNGKLFPFAERNGESYRSYQDLLGLAAILNAKYRSRTFDFLGDSLISRLVQSSLVSKSWDPRNTPGLENDRPVTVGWFNKEGKWVRS